VSRKGDIVWWPFTSHDIPFENGRILFDMWLEKRGKRPYPARSDINPAEMLPVLPYIAICDIERDPFRLKIRLWGTGLLEIANQERTGHYVDDIDHARLFLKRARRLVDEGIPYILTGEPMDWADKPYWSYDALVIPLGEPGEPVNKVITLHEYYPAT
jgi:hypothetical protein